jgi:Putative zinc-finger
MRTLSCKRVAPKISLYVAGDLVGEPEREVAVHLLACRECLRLSEEFSASSSLLTQAWALPEFSAEFYAGIRSNVLADIERERVVPKPSLFRRRWLYATAFAAVVITSGIMLQHFNSTRLQAGQSLALAPLVTGPPILAPANDVSVSSSLQSHALSATARAQIRVKSRRPEASESAQIPRDERGRIAEATQSSTRSQPDTAVLSGGSAASRPGDASSSEVSRIEIQTANPNIRIIWLAPRESQGTEETNSNQDQPKNGNRK